MTSITEYNIYCDETCHLSFDNKNVMVLGAVWCEKRHSKAIAEQIRNIKRKHGFAPQYEVKWIKAASEKKFTFYKDLLEFFFFSDTLHFRALIAHKQHLDHSRFQQTHDDWYYKMYFQLINNILSPCSCYNIYLDIKDTRSNDKTQNLKSIMENSHYAIGEDLIKKIQLIRSHEIEQIQLCDLLIGAIQYKFNRPNSRVSNGKQKILNFLESKSTKDLSKNTFLRESKFNIFHWTGQQTPYEH